MTDLFDVEGENLNLDFLATRDGEHNAELKREIERMWLVYEPYADPDFRQGFARDIHARFWEMYLGCILISSGKQLLPTSGRKHSGGQPDLCVLEGERRIWIEAIAPDDGAEGPDQIVRPIPINEGGGLAPVPTRQAQLRISSAFWEKTKKTRRYREQGIITPEDVCVIAISGSRFGVYISDHPIPLIMKVLFPIGDQYALLNQDNGELIEQGFHFDPHIVRQNGFVPRNAFLDANFNDITGLIWSRVSIGNLRRPITYVHNPLARASLPPNWCTWDREFVTTVQAEEFSFTDLNQSDSSNDV